MMGLTERAPLLIEIALPAAFVPIHEALTRLHRNVGSVMADKVTVMRPGRARMICVACVDDDDVTKLARDLRAELADDPTSLAIVEDVAIVHLADGLRCVVFRGVLCFGVDQ